MSRYTIPNRLLVASGSKPGQLVSSGLEDVLELLAKIQDKQQPIDYSRLLRNVEMSFKTGVMIARINEGDKVKAFRLANTGAGQMSSFMLPNRFFGGLKQLASLDPHGANLASDAWNHFAKHSTPKKRMIRTVKMNFAGDVFRVIRSCHSTQYAPYAHTAFTQDMLDYGGSFSKLPVVGWWLSDRAIRVRMLGVSLDRVDVDKPLPIVDAWNSETGQSRVGLRAGVWRVPCNASVSPNIGRAGWVHRGKRARIQEGVREEFELMLARASDAVALYEEAMAIDIDDVAEWMTERLKGLLTDKVAACAVGCLEADGITEGETLASALDAVGVAALQSDDLYARHDIEAAAGILLQKGLKEADNGLISIH